MDPADKRPTIGSARLLDRAEQLMRSVEHVIGPARLDGHGVARWGPTPAPPYVPAWGCARCDTRWVAIWSSHGRPSCWCCERNDLVYGV